MVNKAIDVYFSSRLDQEGRVDSSLILVNKALEYDDENLSALTHKATLLIHKRDLEGLLEVNSAILELIPNKPYYVCQRALYFEVMGDSVKSEELYQKAISECEKLMHEDSADFDLSLEYVTVLQAHGDTRQADAVLARMRGAGYSQDELEILKGYELMNLSGWRDSSKVTLLKYWRGDIDYDEFGRLIAKFEKNAKIRQQTDTLINDDENK